MVKAYYHGYTLYQIPGASDMWKIFTSPDYFYGTFEACKVYIDGMRGGK